MFFYSQLFFSASRHASPFFSSSPPPLLSSSPSLLPLLTSISFCLPTLYSSLYPIGHYLLLEMSLDHISLSVTNFAKIREAFGAYSLPATLRSLLALTSARGRTNMLERSALWICQVCQRARSYSSIPSDDRWIYRDNLARCDAHTLHSHILPVSGNDTVNHRDGLTRKLQSLGLLHTPMPPGARRQFALD